MCYCVISASVYTSAGPLSLKQNGVFTLVVTPVCTDLHTAHISHRGQQARGEVEGASIRDDDQVGQRDAIEEVAGRREVAK